MSRLSAFIERHHGWFALLVFAAGCILIIAMAFDWPIDRHPSLILWIGFGAGVMFSKAGEK